MSGSKPMVSVKLTGLLVMLLAAVGLAQPSAPDFMELVVSAEDGLMPNSSGAIGGFAWSELNQKFYVATFGGTSSSGSYDGLVIYTPATDTKVIAAYPTQMDLFATAPDIPTGYSSRFDSGNTNPSGMVLNPAPITVNGINYPAESLCYFTDNGQTVYENGSTIKRAWSKRMYRWDLRAIGSATSADPDYDNASDGDGNDVGEFDIADWNDVFTTLFTEQDMINAAGGTGTFNIARKFAFSTDGSRIWLAATSYYSGLWEINASTGALNRIWTDATSGDSIISEAAVVHTSVRDFDPFNPLTGDQIIVDGSTLSGNVGGLNYFIFDGAAYHGPYVLITKEQLQRWAEYNGVFSTTSTTNKRAEVNGQDPRESPDEDMTPFSITADTDGTLYFYDTSDQWVWKYDAEGRFSCIKSKMANYYLHLANNETATAASSLRLQVRHVQYDNGETTFDVPQLLYMDVSLDGVGAAYAFKVGDFNRDNVVDEDDVTLFMAQRATPIETLMQAGTPNRYYEFPTDGSGNLLDAVDVDAYVEYITYDLNGNSLVDEMDRQILWRHMGYAPPDFDRDTNVDLDDLAHFESCVTAPEVPQTTLSCRDADLDNDGDVDQGDFGILQMCLDLENPADPACSDNALVLTAGI